MNYCCEDFEIRVENEAGFYKLEDGTWAICGCTQCFVVQGMKFCPFCGSDLAPRYIVQHLEATVNVLDWTVFDTNRHKVIAYFESQLDAEEYADKLCK